MTQHMADRFGKTGISRHSQGSNSGSSSSSSDQNRSRQEAASKKLDKEALAKRGGQGGAKKMPPLR